MRIVEASSSLVRAEVDIFEGLARKGWSGGGLDELLDKGIDLFANEPEAGHNDSSKLFSILPQKSILDNNNGENSQGPRPNHGRTDSLLDEGDRYQSLAGAVSGLEKGEDTRSIFSEGSLAGNFNRPRGVRPFSPPPLARNHDTQDSMKSTDKLSAKTVIRASLAEAEGSSYSISEVAKDEERGRERRWSVTDDGVVSE
jgi:hypothetical protein